MIKVLGLVVECYREGADERVLRCLIRRLSPDTVVHVRCMGSKRSFEKEAIIAASKLLEEDKCERVFLVWDLQPEWKDQQGNLLDCVKECAMLREQCLTSKHGRQIDLICISSMLEAWIVADDRALKRYFAEQAPKAKIKAVKNPEFHPDPKAILIGWCKSRGRARPYQDHLDAVRILQHCPDTRRLVKVSSCARLIKKLTGSENTNFVVGGDQCNDLAGIYRSPANAKLTFGTSKSL